MRKEMILSYDEELEDNVEKEYTIYTKQEIINYIKEKIDNNDIDLEKYELYLHAPSSFEVTLESLNGLLEEDDEVFIDRYYDLDKQRYDENKKIITLVIY